MIERHLRLCGIAFAGTLMATPAMSQAPAPAVSEGQIVKYIETVNHGEIADAKMALRRSKDADIKNFAKEMIKDHGASDKKMTELARHLKLKPASSEETTSLMSEAKSGDKELRAAKGTDFDKAYIDAQAKMHGEVADTIQESVRAGRDQRGDEICPLGHALDRAKPPENGAGFANKMQ